MIATLDEPLTMEIDMKPDKQAPAPKGDRMKALLARAAVAAGAAAVAATVIIAAGPKIPRSMGD